MKVLPNEMAAALALASKNMLPVSPADRPEDCAVLRVGSAQMLKTEDVTTLVCRDLEWAGRVSALHAMSDVFACLGEPTHAGVLLFARTGATVPQMAALMRGVFAACVEEGVEVTGGHSISSPEWMAGLAILGAVGPHGALGKRGARHGDRLLLSKPVGIGAVLRAHKLGQVGENELAEAMAVMTTSNRAAAAEAGEAGVRSGTDVTGFGLLGSLTEMLDGDLGATVELGRVPVLAAARVLDQQFAQSRWISGNLDYVRSRRRLIGVREPLALMPLLDPQTNGGLLVAADEQAARQLAARGLFSVIGVINNSGKIEVKS